MITNYIPNTCKYNVNNLKKVVHIFSEASNKVYIDNGEAYVTGTVYDFHTISATSVSYNETTSYDDRFKFQKTVTTTVDGFLKLSALGGKYYVVLEDENGILWLVNQDFPSLVTYTYTLEDGKDDTVFTFNALSNFPTLKLNATIGNFNECKSYSLVKVENLKMLEKRYANIDASSSIIYGYSNQVYKTVKFNEGSLSVEEVFDGTNVNTSIQFSINMDDYQSSWHYNVLEYPYNKYVAVIDHLACGFEMGLVPSFNAQGSEIDGSNDTVTITLVGSSQKGSEWANSWTEVTVAPVYTWKLTNEWECESTRWVDGGYTCGGSRGCDKYSVRKMQTKNAQNEWVDTNPLVSAGTLVERYSEDCGCEVPPKIVEWSTQSPFYYKVNCNSSEILTREEVTSGSFYFHEAVIGDCVTEIGDYAFSGDPTFPYLSSVTFVDSSQIKRIGNGAFKGRSGLLNFTIPPSVTSIGNNAFAYCSSPKVVNIPSSMSAIEYSTFYNSNLRTITIPSGVTSIGDYAFARTPLSSITFDDNSQLSVIGNGVFERCTGLTSVVIPNGAASVGRNAFSGCSSLINVDIGVSSVNQYAFYRCYSLKDVTLRASNAVINNFAFCESTGLTNLNMSEGVVTINDNAFRECSGLTRIDIPNSVTTIGKNAFRYCSAASEITIGSGITSIDNYAFDYCWNTTSITFYATTPPNLGYGVFYDTPNVQVIYVPPQSVELYRNIDGLPNVDILPIPN